MTTLYQRLDIALTYSQHMDPSTSLIPVLFVVGLQNFEHFSAFRLNSYKYSAYP